MGIKLIKRHIVLADVESSYGAGASLGDANAILVENFTHNPNQETTLQERGGLTGALSMPKSRLVGRLAGFTFDAELKGSGAAGTPPEIGPLLRACGLEESINAGVDVRYATLIPVAALQSAALDVWDGGADRHQGIGARGVLGLTLEAGTYGRFNVEMTAHPSSPAAAPRPTPVYDQTEPEPLKQITMQIGGYGGWEVYTATLAMNTTISAPPAMTTPYDSGYSSVEITDWNPEIVVSMAAQDIADGYDPFGDMDSGTDRPLVIGAIGAVSGNIVTLDAPTATVTNISTGDQEGRLTYDVTYQLSESELGKSDNFEIIFT